MRLLKFISAFVLAALVIFGFVMGWNWKAFTTFFENRQAMAEGSEWVSKTGSLKGLSEFVGENPEYASLASVVIHHPDSAIYYRPNTPRVMGTTANFFVLIAYASQINSGAVDPDSAVNWREVTEYQLPGIEESVHNETFEAAKNRGWVKNGSIPLKNTLKLLAQYNDPALADYLWWQLNPDVWHELPNTLKLTSTNMPLPYSGLYQAISPGLNKMENSEIIGRWRNKNQKEWRLHVAELSRSFASDSVFRADVQEYMKENRLGNTFMEERDAMILFPKATVKDMVGVLQQMVTDSLINKEVSLTVKNFMDWPFENQSGINRDFTSYGAMYDNRMGLMNGINFGTSAYTGDTTVQALFLDRLPIGFWFHASGSQMHQDFMQRLIYDPAMINQMYRVIEE